MDYTQNKLQLYVAKCLLYSVNYLGLCKIEILALRHKKEKKLAKQTKIITYKSNAETKLMLHT